MSTTFCHISDTFTNVFDSLTTNTFPVPIGFRLFAIARFFYRKQSDIFSVKWDRGLNLLQHCHGLDAESYPVLPHSDLANPR